jgi:hypothetical protein
MKELHDVLFYTCMNILLAPLVTGRVSAKTFFASIDKELEQRLDTLAPRSVDEHDVVNTSLTWVSFVIISNASSHRPRRAQVALDVPGMISLCSEVCS